jgi:hypothetical protein
MREIGTVQLKQAGPGRYVADYLPEQAGVYFIRAPSGSQIVSAGIAHNLVAEAALTSIPANTTGISEVKNSGSQNFSSGKITPNGRSNLRRSLKNT